MYMYKGFRNVTSMIYFNINNIIFFKSKVDYACFTGQRTSNSKNLRVINVQILEPPSIDTSGMPQCGRVFEINLLFQRNATYIACIIYFS